MTDMDLPQVEDLETLANPQPMFKLLRDAGPAVHMEDMDMYIVGGDADVHEVLHHPEVFSSGPEAVQIGQVRPLIPLQIDPPDHKNFRKLLDPLFAPKRIALLEDRTRALVQDLIEQVADDGHCNFHEGVPSSGLAAGYPSSWTWAQCEWLSSWSVKHALRAL